jgi:hypothetical protein
MLLNGGDSMTRKVMRSMVGLVLAGGLAACDSGEGDGPPTSGICNVIAGGGSTVSSSGVGAGFSNAAAIFDGSLRSFGTIEGAGTATIQGTLQSGVVEPGGHVVGFLFSGFFTSNTNVTITTYLEGQPQDAGPPVSTVEGGPYSFWGIHTNAPYDSVQIAFNLTQGDSAIDIFEICSRD